MLVARNVSPTNLINLLPDCTSVKRNPSSLRVAPARPEPSQPENWNSIQAVSNVDLAPATQLVACDPVEVDPLFLLACLIEWEHSDDPGVAWEVIAAARSPHSDTRAHARSLLERMPENNIESTAKNPPINRNVQSLFPSHTAEGAQPDPTPAKAPSTKVPYGLSVVDSCVSCKLCRENFFCRFSPSVQRAVDRESYHSVMPSGTLLFVEGQSPRGVYVVCSGKVKLYTTSREGKILILKQVEAGGVLGLSASISGTNYEMTAETSTHCQLNFIGRSDLLKLLQTESEIGVRAALALSREFRGAYRDIHDLLLARSSSGKLAKLLLSCAPQGATEKDELRLRVPMTHEEMAQRIGSSRETVTRLLSTLKKKRLIRIEGATLVIRNRSGLESLAT